MSMDALGRALAGRPNNRIHLERVTITQASPLLVQLASGATVPGLALRDHTYTVGLHGVALLQEGMMPPVWPTLT